jgi:hypothetical protein
MPHLDEGQLAALFDHELDAAEQRTAEAHLAACEECRALWEEIREFAGEADRLVATVELPPKRLAPPVLPTPLPAPAARPDPRPLPWRNIAWAATLLLAVGLGYSMRGLSRPQTAGAPQESANEARLADKAAAAGSSQTATPSPSLASTPTDAGRSTSREERAEGKLAAPAAAPAAPAAPAIGGSASDLAAAPPRADDRLGPGANGAASTESLRDATPPVAAMQEAEQPSTAAQMTSPRRTPGATPLTRARLAPDGTGFRPVEMEEAVRALDGAIRLVDGLEPERLLLAPANLLPGGDPGRPVVRVVYQDPPGRELWLDQQRVRPQNEDNRKPSPTGILPGDTILAPIAGGAQRVRWLDQHGFLLGLTGFLPGDSLQALISRVR